MWANRNHVSRAWAAEIILTHKSQIKNCVAFGKATNDEAERKDALAGDVKI